MDLLKAYIHKIRTPVPNEKIYKDECVLSFDTPVIIEFILINYYYF
jgi:hypothetical protein